MLSPELRESGDLTVMGTVGILGGALFPRLWMGLFHLLQLVALSIAFLNFAKILHYLIHFFSELVAAFYGPYY